jgi:hypothetical protein
VRSRYKMWLKPHGDVWRTGTAAMKQTKATMGLVAVKEVRMDEDGRG